jgi:hypothetical protein
MDARVKPAHDSLAVEGRSRCFQADAKPVKLVSIEMRLSSSKGHTP